MEQRFLLPSKFALAVTLLMGIAITVLDVLQPAEPALSILAFAPGLASIAPCRPRG